MNKNTNHLPSFIQTLLASPPPAGAGVHGWLFKMARQLHAYLPAYQIVALLESKVANCGRHVPQSEILSSVKNSLGCAWMPFKGITTTKSADSLKWPTINEERRREIILAGGGLADLSELSPIRLKEEQQTEVLIDTLFPGNPLLCCAKTSQEFNTKTREEWRGELSGLSLIVPSPMSSVTGTTKNGKASKHCLENTGPRRYLVCEFDSGTIDEHASLLIHLACFAPLICAVYSGGKSLHGWFAVQGIPQETVISFFRYAVSLGADPALWCRCQFCRMPDGIRDNKKRQFLQYLNINPLTQLNP